MAGVAAVVGMVTGVGGVSVVAGCGASRLGDGGICVVRLSKSFKRASRAASSSDADDAKLE